MKKETIYRKVSATKELPELNKQVCGFLQDRPAIVSNSNLVDGYVTANGNLEPKNLVEFLKEEKDVYVLSEDELRELIKDVMLKCWREDVFNVQLSEINKASEEYIQSLNI